jgi:mannosyltransferase OCH1-like enzyme
MERLSILSFLHEGHPFHLFTYGPVEGVPEGCIVEDAREVLPKSRIFRYRDFPSYAGFANVFRYKLLLDRGGWWVDTDTVCLKPFEFEQPYVFGTEADREGRDVTNNGFLKAPAGNAAMAYATEVCLSKRPDDLVWGETGPRLMQEIVARFALERYRQPHRVFCPIGFRDWARVLEPGVDWEFGVETRAVHLWNEMWRRGGRDKDASYPPDCLYERLKALHL